MRKSDKKKNFLKVNLLAEQRYLQSKGIVTESFHEADGAPIGVDKNHMPITEYGQSKQFDLRDERNMNALVSTILSYLGKEKTNDASIANDNKVIVYTELLNRLMQMSPPSSFNHGENGNEIYTNNPEAMKQFLAKFKVGGDFKFIGSDGRIHNDTNEGWVNLGEDDLSNYRGEMLKTGDYPWSTFLGDKQKGEDEQIRNSEASKNFMQQFNRAYMGQTIETTNGLYTFTNIKYRNNHGNYDLIFTKPKGENDWMDKTLWIAYDPTDGYYILDRQGEGIQLIDDESKQKVIEMLSYNK